MQVDVTNYVIAMRQARARYDAAVRNVTLARQLLDAEGKKLALGASTPSLVIQQQRDLANAQSTVIGAEATYISARVALDQSLGTTLEANHVAIDEARIGVVSRVTVPSSRRQASSQTVTARVPFSYFEPEWRGLKQGCRAA